MGPGSRSLVLSGWMALVACQSPGDPAPPRPWSVSPADGARDVELETPVVLEFSTPMDCGSLGDGGLVVASGDGPVAGALGCQASSATFRPASPLGLATRYSVSVGTGARDLAGLAVAHPFTSGFTTRSRTVASVSPPDGARGISTRPRVEVTFRDPVGCEEVDAGVSSPSGPTEGAWGCSLGLDASVLTFTPTLELAGGTTYAVSVSSAAPDAGRAPVVPFLSTFTTLQPPPRIEATVRSFPAGRTPAGFLGAEVRVLDLASGWSIADAGVTVNGVELAYEPLTGRYLGDVQLAPGAPVALVVATGAGTATASGAQPATLPLITSPLPGTRWTAGCNLPVSWSGGAAGPDQQEMLQVLDGAQPNRSLAEVSVWPGQHTVSSFALGAGPRLIAAGVSTYLPIDGGTSSLLRLAELDLVPVVIETSYFTSLRLEPSDAGLAPGDTLRVRALGGHCGESLPVTELASFSSSAPTVATVSDARGSRGQVTALGEGRAVISATLDGLTASASLAVTLDGGAP